MHRVGWVERLQLELKLLLEDLRGRRGGDEPEEGWRGVEWTSAELGVSLQANEVRVIYECNLQSAIFK